MRKVLIGVAAVALVWQATPASASSGGLDTSFGTGGKVLTSFPSNDDLHAVAVQSDGKIVVAGRSDSTWAAYLGHPGLIGPGTSPDFTVARYNTDGTPDTTFGRIRPQNDPSGPSNGISAWDLGGTAGPDEAFGVVVLSGGRIVTVGSEPAFHQPGNLAFGLARLTANGTSVTSGVVDFGPHTDRALDAAVQASGKIVVAGYSNTGNHDQMALTRVATDLGVDATFGSNGTIRTAYSANARATAVAVTPADKILVAGYVGDGANRRFLLRQYKTGGDLDVNNFGTAGVVKTTVGSGGATANDMTVLSDGSILVTGTALKGAQQEFAVVRYTSDGTLDTSFGTGGKVLTKFGAGPDTASGVAGVAGGAVTVAGRATIGGHTVVAVARYTHTGSPDSTFGTGGKVTTAIGTSAAANTIALVGQKTLVAGYAKDNSEPDFALLQYTKPGAPDPAFATSGATTTDVPGPGAYANAVALQSNGKIVTAGYAYGHSPCGGDFAVARYHADGTLDSSFGHDGMVTTDFKGEDLAHGVAIQPDGKIVVVGTYGAVPCPTASVVGFAMARYNTDGTLDTSFGHHGKVMTRPRYTETGWTSVALQRDGDIVVLGQAASGTGVRSFGVFRYLPSGTLDHVYGANGLRTIPFKHESTPWSVRVDSSGRAVAAGEVFNGTSLKFAVVRLTHGGDRDNSFSSDGGLATTFGSGDDVARGLRFGSGGRIVVVGFAATASGGDSFALARYESTGDLDTSFSSDGKVKTRMPAGPIAVGRAVAIDNGKIIVVGQNSRQFAVARYLASGDLDAGFGTGGKVITHFPQFTGSEAHASANAVAIQTDGRIVVAGQAYDDDPNQAFFQDHVTLVRYLP